MTTAGDPMGALADVFTWTGLGGAVLWGILALILRVADGTWLPARAVVEDLDSGPVVRWIDADGGVNEAPLSAAERAQIGPRDMADIFARRGSRNRMRLTHGSPAVRAVWLLALGFAVLGVVAFALSLVLLAVAG